MVGGRNRCGTSSKAEERNSVDRLAMLVPGMRAEETRERDERA